MTVQTPQPPVSTLAVVGLPPMATTSTKSTSRRPRKPRKWLRTRDREQLHQLNLQLDINSLHSEIRALLVTRDLLRTRILNQYDDGDGSYVKMVHEYFNQTRHGYLDPTKNQQMVRARRFLDVLFDPQVQKGHLRGIELCIAMIQRYTEAFGPVTHQLLSAFVQADPNAPDHGSRTVLVRARTRYCTSVVDKTFDTIFPFAGREIRELLLGKPVEGEGEFDIVFDVTTNRVVRFDIQFDFVPAFARIVSDPRLLGQLFSGALVKADCTIGDEKDTNNDVEDLTVEPEIEMEFAPEAGSTTPVKDEWKEPSAPSPSRSRVMDIRSLLNDDDC